MQRKPRKPSEFSRIYGSRARVAWVKSLRCIVAAYLRCDGPIQNAHTETGGTGRKADARTIVPACQRHHDEMHQGVQTFERRYCVDLRALAAATESAWLAAQAAA